MPIRGHALIILNAAGHEGNSSRPNALRAMWPRGARAIYASELRRFEEAKVTAAQDPSPDVRPATLNSRSG